MQNVTENSTPFEGKQGKETISAGRVLYLTLDPDLIRHQLTGGQLMNVPEDMLLDSISTDEIIPNRACLSWTGKEEGHLGRFLLTGLRGGAIKPGEIAAGNFQTVVAGPSFARGSSRIHAPLAFQDAGVNLIIAPAERIFSENCTNLRIHLLDPQSNQGKRLLNGESIPDEELLGLMSEQSANVMRSGSLLAYLDAVEEGKISVPEIKTESRPMTAVEKIIARKALTSGRTVGVKAVKPGDEVVAIPDLYYGYELQTNATIKALREQFGDETKVRQPDKIFLYNDHTALLTDDATATLRREQTKFASPLNITVYEANPISGAPAICHTDMLEHHALPGQLVLGNDSHTDTLGVLNNLAVGKGAIDLAGAIAYDKMIITVPETIRINLTGNLPEGITLKDFMMQFGARAELKTEGDRLGFGSGKVFEFGGDALDTIPVEEQMKLSNMSIELQGFTGILEPNRQIIAFLKEKRGMTEDEIGALFVGSDKDADYSRVYDIDLSTVETTVAEPGDTQNGKPLSEIREQNIPVDKAYIGSCTHGTVEDLRQAAEVLRGRKIANGVKLYVQASSIENLHEATRLGYMQELAEAGAEVLMIGCGACMNAGPGSVEEGEVGIFATNRNFPGRTGRGRTYLSNPAVAAASAVKGVICGPEDIN